MCKGYFFENFLLSSIGYDIENPSDATISVSYKGEITTDRYGRKTPKQAHGTINLDRKTSSSKLLCEAVLKLYDRIINPNLSIRRVTVTLNKVIDEYSISDTPEFEQLNLFTDYAAEEKKREQEKKDLEKEKRMQQAMLDIKKKFGKNAILKGMNLQEGATTKERNNQIGGHQA